MTNVAKIFDSNRAATKLLSQTMYLWCLSIALLEFYSIQFAFICYNKLLNYVIVRSYQGLFHAYFRHFTFALFTFTWNTFKLDKAQAQPGQIWNSYLYWNMIGLSMSFKLMIWQNPWKPRYKTLVFLCHIFLRMGGPGLSLLSLPHTRNNRKFYLFTK